MTRKSWRDIYPVHPAADVFPMMTKEELRDLGKDIKKNGLQHPIRTFLSDQHYVVDGRNRLDAMELAGTRTIGDDGCLACSYGPIRDGDDPTTYVISANIKRRHLTKKQQADLIVMAVESAKSTDLAKMAKSVKRTTKGHVQGSTKDPVKAKIIEEAEKNDISKRTAERAIADHRDQAAGGAPRRYVTCPECSAKVADLDKHLRLRHKRKAGAAPSEHSRSQETVRQLEKALMNTKEATARCMVYEVLADKAALKKMLRLYDELEESITLGRERIKNRPPDKEIKRVLSLPRGGASIKKLGP